MELFHEIFWWFGVVLFSAATTLFYGTLGYGAYLQIKDWLVKSK
jgi:hypothetical protein